MLNLFTFVKMRNRTIDIVKRYSGLVNIWDAINEATVSERFDNPFGKCYGRVVRGYGR